MKQTLLYRAARKVYRTIVPRRPSVWALNEQYDRQTVEVMKRTLRPDSTGVDIGAHAGAFLREMFSLAPRGRHFAFEPLPHLAASLSRNYPEARVHAVALSDYNGTGTFHYVVNSPAESGLQRHAIHGDASNVQEITVPIRRLDDLIGLDERIAFIKIDALQLQRRDVVDTAGAALKFLVARRGRRRRPRLAHEGVGILIFRVTAAGSDDGGRIGAAIAHWRTRIARSWESMKYCIEAEEAARAKLGR